MRRPFPDDTSRAALIEMEARRWRQLAFQTTPLEMSVE